MTSEQTHRRSRRLRRTVPAWLIREKPGELHRRTVRIDGRDIDVVEDEIGVVELRPHRDNH